MSHEKGTNCFAKPLFIIIIFIFSISLYGEIKLPDINIVLNFPTPTYNYSTVTVAPVATSNIITFEATRNLLTDMQSLCFSFLIFAVIIFFALISYLIYFKWFRQSSIKEAFSVIKSKRKLIASTLIIIAGIVLAVSFIPSRENSKEFFDNISSFWTVVLSLASFIIAAITAGFLYLQYKINKRQNDREEKEHIIKMTPIVIPKETHIKIKGEFLKNILEGTPKIVRIMLDEKRNEKEYSDFSNSLFYNTGSEPIFNLEASFFSDNKLIEFDSYNPINRGFLNPKEEFKNTNSIVYDVIWKKHVLGDGKENSYHLSEEEIKRMYYSMELKYNNISNDKIRVICFIKIKYVIEKDNDDYKNGIIISFLPIINSITLNDIPYKKIDKNISTINSYVNHRDN